MSKQWGHGFYAGQKAASKTTFPLGYLVHIPGDDPQKYPMEFQGKVIGRTSNGYAVQLYSFLDGRPTSIRIFSEAAIQQSTFYDMAEEWRAAADHFLAVMNREEDQP